jgi:hypothetical protein
MDEEYNGRYRNMVAMLLYFHINLTKNILLETSGLLQYRAVQCGHVRFGVVMSALVLGCVLP